MRQGDTHLHEYQLDTHAKNRHLTITQCGCTDPETDAPSILTPKLPVLPPHPYAFYLSLLHSSASQHQSNEVHTPTHSYALNLSFPCMCSPHLLGLKHLHNTQQNPSLSPHRQWLHSPGLRKHVLIAQLTPSHSLLGTQTEKYNCSTTASMASGNIFMSGEERKSPSPAYPSTHLPHSHLGQALLPAAQLADPSCKRLSTIQPPQVELY